MSTTSDGPFPVTSTRPTPGDAKTIREFHGDNVWRDGDGTIWMRLDESIAMQEFAWNQAVAAVDSACTGSHGGMVQNPFQNALLLDPTKEN